jgi:hypothetical protein
MVPVQLQGNMNDHVTFLSRADMSGPVEYIRAHTITSGQLQAILIVRRVARL